MALFTRTVPARRAAVVYRHGAFEQVLRAGRHLRRWVCGGGERLGPEEGFGTYIFDVFDFLIFFLNFLKSFFVLFRWFYKVFFFFFFMCLVLIRWSKSEVFCWF